MGGKCVVAVAVLMQLVWLGPVRAGDDWVRVVPQETDEILANPAMGWQTFHRTAPQDKSLPAWIPSTVHYARWGWGQLEPEQGQIDYAFLDGVLRQTREAGQTLAFRVMCCSTTPRQPYHPGWLRQTGGRIIRTQRRDGPSVEIPDLDDPKILGPHLDFIRRLGARYDGHPDLDHVDLGSVGWWGEWHMSGATNATMPTLETQRKIVDAYLAAFKRTPLLMLIGGGEMLKYATARGTGWRADCLGDMGGFSKTWNHMRMAYPKMLPAASAMDTWKTSPVAWETCWDMRKWVAEGWPLRFIFNYALALHGSYINNKSAPLPEGDQVRAELERFLRRLGYRLVLRELRHPAEVQAGQNLPVAMKWQNVGSAPCYRPYRLAYRLSNGAGLSRVFASRVTVHRWLPGSIELFAEEFFKQPADLPAGEVVDVEDAIPVPGDLPPGQYTLSLAVVGQQSEKPVVQLGIKGRAEDGWYPLSKLLVK
ncbi:MAG: DUF4832 domain-containing protein [Thermoguttaceae bacterium]